MRQKHCHCIQQERQVPLRTNIDVPKSNGQSLYMPAYVEGGEGALGVKIVSVYPENIKKTYQVYQQR